MMLVTALRAYHLWQVPVQVKALVAALPALPGPEPMWLDDALLDMAILLGHACNHLQRRHWPITEGKRGFIHWRKGGSPNSGDWVGSLRCLRTPVFAGLSDAAQDACREGDAHGPRLFELA